jgi:hypothetical protein
MKSVAKKKLITLIFVLITAKLFAQFNDSTHHYFNYSSTGSINKTQDGNAYLLNNGLKLSIKKKSFVSNFSNSWIYGKQNKSLTNNDFSSTLDFNLYKTLPRFYYWGLANYNTSYSLNINHQLLTGLGVAYNIIDKENQKLNISNGILYDRSDIVLDNELREVYSTARNSFRLSFKFTIWSRVILESTSFIQNSFEYKDDYIIRSASGISVPLAKWVAFTTNFTYNRFNRTARENMLLNYGLKVEKYF